MSAAVAKATKGITYVCKTHVTLHFPQNELPRGGTGEAPDLSRILSSLKMRFWFDESETDVMIFKIFSP
jgi:hypothetical protein